MNNWVDPFTGVSYRITESWAGKVRQHLAELLSRQLRGSQDAQQSANRCAEFWHRYYDLTFPLRFGRGSDHESFVGEKLFEIGVESEIDLEGYGDHQLRSSFLEGRKLPPLLTAETSSPNRFPDLIADHHLLSAALCNVILRAQGKGDTDIFHQVRLGVLVHELIEESALQDLTKFPEALQIAHFLKHGAGDLPNAVDGQLLNSIHAERLPDGSEIALVGVGAQRIKQFVFESPGLNEIRGASTLLDDCIARLKVEISKEIGPEVILRAAAATLEFLAPTCEDANGEVWTERLRKYFYQHTGTAFVAAAAIKVAPSKLLTGYQNVLSEFQAVLEHDRYQPDLPLSDSLPFEVRCSLCGHRAADGWEKNPEGNHSPICRVCITKRKLGRKKRSGKINELLRWLGRVKPSELGVKAQPANPGEKYPSIVARDLGQLVPDEAKRKKLAVIYGDGNNFGDVVRNLSSLALSLQWTHRIEKVTQAAVALALAHATKEVGRARINPLPKLPFQILSLGGDDLSLLTWGRIGLRACEQFLRLTDLEFQPGDGPRLTDKSLAFSLGALFCDDKAPVRRTVDFAENELLKWAKRAARRPSNQHGNLAFQLALMAEQIPADLKAYRNQMFLRGGDKELCLTLRPFTADELSFLLKKAFDLKTERQEGLLQNLVAAFVQSPYPTALLHYYYQNARVQGGAPELAVKSFFAQLEGRTKPGLETDWAAMFGGFPLVGIETKKPNNFFFEWRAAKPSARLPFGEERDNATSKVTLLSPLWDLHEIVKILE